MNYKKILEEQIEVLIKENKENVDPEQIRKNVETILNLIIFITSNF